MAAGRGNRMRPFTDLMPKSMAPYQNDTLIGHSLLKLGNQVSSVHITVGYKKIILASYLLEKGGVASIHNTEGHGNAWWIQNTLLTYVDEPVLVLTTDNITEIDVQLLYNEYESCGSPACMIVPTNPVVQIEGDFLFCEGNRVTQITRECKSDKYCSGIQVINPRKVTRIVNDPLTDDFYSIWDKLIATNELYAANLYPYQWYSVDTLEQLLSLPRE
jgi:NDP-sugar pyrophosphorylase family protein